MAKQLNEETSFNISIKTLAGIAALIFTIVGMGFTLQADIAEAKELYDVIVIDTPPCLLVSDTLNISYLADLLLFVVRCNHTSKEVLDFIKDSYANKIIKDNSMLVLNGLGSSSRYGYAYNYSYGYKYTYNYNYGYGYDYSSDN